MLTLTKEASRKNNNFSIEAQSCWNAWHSFQTGLKDIGPSELQLHGKEESFLHVFNDCPELLPWNFADS